MPGKRFIVVGWHGERKVGRHIIICHYANGVKANAPKTYRGYTI